MPISKISLKLQLSVCCHSLLKELQGALCILLGVLEEQRSFGYELWTVIKLHPFRSEVCCKSPARCL